MLTVQDSPPAWLARCLCSSSGPHSLLSNRLLECSWKHKTSRAQPNSISNVFIDKLSEGVSAVVFMGLSPTMEETAEEGRGKGERS